MVDPLIMFRSILCAVVFFILCCVLLYIVRKNALSFQATVASAVLGLGRGDGCQPIFSSEMKVYINDQAPAYEELEIKEDLPPTYELLYHETVDQSAK